MAYSTTITQKGQVTIPKTIREMFQLNRYKKITIEVKKQKQEITLKPAYDFLEVARKIKVKKKIDPVKARAYMETHYERA